MPTTRGSIPLSGGEPADAGHGRIAGRARVSGALYARLAPMCAPLPNDKLVVNINTIKPEQAALLVGALPGQDIPRRCQTGADQQAQEGWKNKQEMTEQFQVQPGAITGLDGALDIKSSFFEAHLLAEVGGDPARLETVFQRGKDNKLVMLRRLERRRRMTGEGRDRPVRPAPLSRLQPKAATLPGDLMPAGMAGE